MTQIALVEARCELACHPVRVVRRQGEAELALAVRLHGVGEVGLCELGQVLVGEAEAEPVAARLRQRLRQPLRQPAEAMRLIDQTQERLPLRVGAEPLRRLPEPIDDHRPDQVGRVPERL